MRYSVEQHLSVCATILSALVLTGSTGCGRMPRIDRATLKVHSTTKPRPGADANKQEPAGPAATPSAQPSPSATNPSDSPADPAPTPTFPAPPPTIPPPIISKSFAVVTGGSVASNKVQVVYGTAPAFERLEVRRSAGAVAPDCAGGTIVRELKKPFIGEGLTFIDQTDAAFASFSYRACYYDATGQSEASSEQPTAVTKAHILLISTPNLNGNLGGVDGAAITCRNTAVASNLLYLSDERTWQPVLSDSVLHARERVQVLGRVTSTNASTTQLRSVFAEDATSLWSSGLAASPPSSILDNTGHASQALVWTGSDGSGLRTPNHCSDWSNATAMSNGDGGDATTLSGQGWLNGGAGAACSQLRSIYCMSAVAPMLQATTSTTTAHSVDLTVTPSEQWTSEGFIEIRRRPYPGIPSADCASALDTPILSIHPLSAAVTIFNDDQASGNTAYNYRACLLDKNGSLVYSSLVQHVSSSP